MRQPESRQDSDVVLGRFGAATRHWFERTFARATEVQRRGWQAISGGENALLIAPTGSGKTLAAFLWCIDRLIAERARPVVGVQVVYVSPLKALVYDIERNLRGPLAGIRRAADDLGLELALPRVGVRTGDSSPRDRRELLRNPADILVTTPESLYLMLGSQAREHLRSVVTVIVDEVHALAPTKRGAHLALSLERLQHLCEVEPQRIGLSATASPLDAVAGYLGGTRPVSIVDTSARPKIDIEIVVPVEDMTRPDPPSATDVRAPGKSLVFDDDDGSPAASERGLWPTIYPRLIELIRTHQSTIVFVNSRGLCERLTQRLNDIAEEELCRSHHGSVSHAERRAVEEQLKGGQIRCIVATSSLELGIDMGAVDLVILVESPGSVARGLQRIGRAGHSVGEVSIGRIFPKHRGDLLEAAVVAERMAEGAIESLALPMNPLDILAQQIVAAVAMDDWEVEALRTCLTGAASFAELPDTAWEAVLDMLSGRYPSHTLAELRPRILWDRQTNVLSARKGSKMLSLVSGGTIPDRGTYAVYLADESARVGELDEEMVHETIPGQIFTLGASSWRVEQITRDRVLVSPAPGEAGKLPFWRGDGPGRPVELGRAMGTMVRELFEVGDEAARDRLMQVSRLDELAARNLQAYLREQAECTGTPPTDRDIVIERFRDELGDWRVCILSPFGARVHAPWALAIEARLSERTGYDVQSLWTDDGIALRLADGDELPDLSILLPDPDQVEEQIVDQLGHSSLFASQFRENAARSLLLPRRRPGARTPLWVQRLKSQELLAVAREYPSFPVVMETYRSCLRDVFDVPALIALLRDIRSRAVRVIEAETVEPSPFARSLAFAYVAAYLYEGDAPMAERRAQALALDRRLLSELLGQEDLRELLDADVIAELERELQGTSGDRRCTHLDDLHALLRRVGDVSSKELADRSEPDLMDEIASHRRAVRMRIGGEDRWVAIEDAGLYRDAIGSVPPSSVPSPFLDTVDHALRQLIGRYARTHGPFHLRDVARRYDLAADRVQAALAELESSGVVVSGVFLPGGDEREYCDADVLRRIKRRTLAALRNQVEPVPAQALARFLPRWHGIGERAGGIHRLREVVAQLEGVPLPYSALERSILPARVPDFRHAMLDELGAIGAVVWVGHGSIGNRDGKIALYRRERVATLLEPPDPGDRLSPLARSIHDELCGRGASFFSVIREAFASESLVDIGMAMDELTWAGLVTNDTFAPVRSRAGLRSRGRGAARAQLQALAGRWSATRDLAAYAPSPTERAHARAITLLERHGIVSREVCELEPIPGGFTQLYPILRQMEEIGRVRRGYFVEQVGGIQFALPGAVDRLRSADASTDAVVLAASDPANPYGWLLPWPTPPGPETPRPRRVAGAFVALFRGEPVLYIGPGGKALTTFPAAEDREVFTRSVEGLCHALRSARRRRILIEQIDGERARSSPRWQQLVEAGAIAMATGLELQVG